MHIINAYALTRHNKWPFHIPAVPSLVLTERVKGRGARPDGGS